MASTTPAGPRPARSGSGGTSPTAWWRIWTQPPAAPTPENLIVGQWLAGRHLGRPLTPSLPLPSLWFMAAILPLNRVVRWVDGRKGARPARLRPQPCYDRNCPAGRPGGATFLKGIVVNHLLAGELSGAISPPLSPSICWSQTGPSKDRV